MRKTGWKITAVAALLAASIGLNMKSDLFSVFASASSSGGTIDQLEEELASHFQSRSEHFTLQYKGDKHKLSDGLQNTINVALSQDDYTAYILDSYLYTIRSWGNLSTIKLEARYRETTEQTAVVDEMVSKAISRIITPQMNEHEKVKAIHDWVVDKLQYDETLKHYTAYDALTTGTAVCQGYSLLAYKMLKASGIPVLIAEGKVKTGDHAWNMVELSGNWYHLDMTWDDPVVKQAGTQQAESRLSYNYYLKTDEEMRADHQWVKSYPAATQSYSSELSRLESTDSAKADVYEKLTTDLGLHWAEPEHTVASLVELEQDIREAVMEEQTSMHFRYLHGSELATDLPTAFKQAHVSVRYSAHYEPYGNDGSMLVQVQLDYQ
ncbi:Transglutaminase-like superfamily protein [Paenibacillus catalpae]|uniref:Transglutaminase-like superfamily protein n=1 Tax=Paenibacillus catalpae TaxID=1045775 RepID=A0A1I1XW74_9BACL|nr:transglutaminase domain-containing protein [Paenibacillus catalpae]SFE11615.1 Transglutaminase-like superfamily protein [Paenibacillus catalpae]